MQLQLGAPSLRLQDGSGSWNAVAADAFATWNQYLDAVKFSPADKSAYSGSQDDSVNSVFFSGDVFGQAWGSNTLAVTL